MERTDDMSTPVVSVVVATYKRDSELKNALESLALQSISDFEIVLVDDNGNAERRFVLEEKIKWMLYGKDGYKKMLSFDAYKAEMGIT